MPKKLVIFGLVMGVTGMGAYLGYKEWHFKKLQGPDAPDAVRLEDILEDKTSIDDLPKVQDPPPAAINIEMPFFTQAPFSNWDYPWQEACEEASVLLVANLYNHMNLDTAGFNDWLLKLVDWEVETFGAYEHTTVAQTVEMLETNFQLKAVVHEDPSFEDFQEILAEGHLIIAPFAGQYLGNPNYKNGGPIYHMMVVKGYDTEKMQIVTHDVGTRNGADYVYDWETVEFALHDWHDGDILLGEPRIIEVLPN